MKKNRRIVVILGMHRGGVGVLARGIQALGVAFGGKVPDRNERTLESGGESNDFVEMNDTLLDLVGKRWSNLVLPRPETMESVFTPYQEEALALLERGFSESTLCGMMDPRASRLLSFWQSVFLRAGMDDCYVIALRNPVSVARSLAAEYGFKPARSYQLWLSYMLAAIRDTAGKPRIVVDYDALLADPITQLNRVGGALKLPVTETTERAVVEYADNLQLRWMRHGEPDGLTARDDPRAGNFVVRAYDLMCRLARDDVQTPQQSPMFEEEWLALGQAERGSAPLFAYLDDCEDRIDALTPSSEAPTSAPVEMRPVPVTVRAPEAMVKRPQTDAVVSKMRVSIVIPLYNHEQYIDTAINSVLMQTVRPAEIIVIDDGSTDGSAARMREICKEHPEVIFWSWPNQGTHHTLNAAIHRATGDFVAILNSDDSYPSERLEACLAAVQADPTVDVVATGVSFIDETGQCTASAWYEEVRSFYKEEGDLSLGLFNANFLLTTSNLFIRRSVFESVGYFTALRYTHDLEFFLRLILAKKHVHYLDRPLLAYRFHEQNTITENQARVDVELAAIFAFFLYRHERVNGDQGIWRTWLDRYVEILGRKKLLELVEYFLAILAAKPVPGAFAGAETLAAEFRGLLSQLGVDWAAHQLHDSLLARFVAARNAFLDRWERVSSASSLKMALGKQERTIAALRLGFEEQERSIEQFHAKIQPLEGLLAEKDRDSRMQADEIHRLDGILAEKDRASQVQTDEIHRLDQVLVEKDRASQIQADEIHRLYGVLKEQAEEIHRVYDALKEQTDELERLHRRASEQDRSLRKLGDTLSATERELAVLKQSNWYKLGEALRQKDLSPRKLARVAYYFVACLTPQRWKPALQPSIERLARRYKQHSSSARDIPPQSIRQRSDRLPDRPRILHVIANFMLGGSSRLVADLIEGLGDAYQHKVVTSHLPIPPAYVGVDVAELGLSQSPENILTFLREYDPAIVHVHYWGDCDWRWYDVFFHAIQSLGCRVVENINTPVQPYKADFVDRYVYVSNYVRQEFGDDRAPNQIIYPGSDFDLFSRTDTQPLPPDCIGMVYRLETDKLNLQSIDVFIKVVQKRPRTKAIIVGGGSYLEPYRHAVRAAGVMANFEFTDYVDYAMLPALYKKLSIFVAPVWKESFGQVSPFAMNLGIPVVGYRVGGLAEIVDDDSLLAPLGDCNALADLVIQLLDDPVRCREIGARNHARAQALFSVEAMVDAYRVLYEELMETLKCE